LEAIAAVDVGRGTTGERDRADRVIGRSLAEATPRCYSGGRCRFPPTSNPVSIERT
jgi:hypothetical protein